MLGIGLKGAQDMPNEFPRQILSYITHNFSAEESKRLAPCIQSLSAFRSQVCFGLQVAGEYERTRKLSEGYFMAFSQLEERFPFGKNKSGMFGLRNKKDHIELPFQWWESFEYKKGKRERRMHYNAGFEMACILFNIGALYSREATAAKREGPDGLKEACQLFRNSAGVFQYLLKHEKCAPHIQAPVGAMDLDQTVLKFFSSLMIAQAQGCIFEKATLTGMSPALVAKLAAGTAKLYDDAKAASLHCGKLFKKTKYPWDAHCDYQRDCFYGASYFWHSKHVIAEAQGATPAYGVEIGYLEKANQFLQSASGHDKDIIEDLITRRNTFAKAIQDRLTDAIYSNETVYFAERISSDECKAIPPTIVAKIPEYNPADSVSAELKRIAIAAGTPDQELLIYGDFDAKLFDSLIPHEVGAALEDFNGKANALINRETKSVQDAEVLAKTQLASMNLPAALEAINPDNAFPQEVWARIQDIQYKGGLEALEKLHKSVCNAAGQVEEDVEKMQQVLTKEVNDDDEMRSRFAHRWNRRPSAQLNAAFQKDLDTIKEYLRNVQSSTEAIQKEMKENKASFDTLAKSQSELTELLPKVQGDSVANNPHRLPLSQSLSELSALFQSRTSIVEEITNKCDPIRDRLRSSLLSNHKLRGSGHPADYIINISLQEFGEEQKRLEESIRSQEPILEKIVQQNESFVKAKDTNSELQQREDFIQSLNLSANLFEKLLANLNEGLKLYSDLTTSNIVPLQQRIGDYVVARDIEKRMILEQLTQAFAPPSGGDAKVTPPTQLGMGGSSSLQQQQQQQQQPSQQPQQSQARGAHNPNLQHGAPVQATLYQAPLPSLSNIAAPLPQQQQQQQQQQQYHQAPNSNYSQPPNNACPNYPQYQQVAPQAPQYHPQPQAPQYQPQAINPNYQYAQPQRLHQQQMHRQPQSQQGYAPVQNNPHAQQGVGVVHAQMQGQQQRQAWNCPTCTYVNPLQHLQCSMCQTEQPSNK